GEVGSERRGAKAVVAAVDRGLQDGASYIAGCVRVGIGEILGGLGNELIDVVGLELDAVLERQRPVREIGDAEVDRLRRIGGCGVAVAVGADRRRISVELEGIESREGIGIVGLGGCKSS